MPKLTPEQIEEKVAEYRRTLEEQNDPNEVNQAIRRNRERALKPNALTSQRRSR